MENTSKQQAAFLILSYLALVDKKNVRICALECCNQLEKNEKFPNERPEYWEEVRNEIQTAKF